MKHFTKKYKT